MKGCEKHARIDCIDCFVEFCSARSDQPVEGTVECDVCRPKPGEPCARWCPDGSPRSGLSQAVMSEIVRERAEALVEVEALREGGRQLDGVIERLVTENERLQDALRKLAGIVIADAEAMDRGYLHYDVEYEGIVRDRANAAARILGEVGLERPESPYA